MEESARYLMFNGVIILLAGLLAGIPYGRAILNNTNKRLIEAWKVAHAALSMGAILLLVISVSISDLNVAITLKWIISALFIISGYGFMVALLIGPVVGHRGISSGGPKKAKLVYAGNLIGAVTSLFATVTLLYAAWLNL